MAFTNIEQSNTFDEWRESHNQVGNDADASKTKTDLITVTQAVDLDDTVLNADAATTDMNFVVDEDNMSSNSDTKLSTQQSIVAYVGAQIASAIASEMSYEGGYDANTNTPDLEAGTGVAKGDTYTVTAAGTFFASTNFEVGDFLIAEIASPTLESDWTVVNKNLDAASILASLLTVDGAGSGLDADLLDGQSGDYYYDSAAEALAKLLTVDGAGSGLDADLLDGQSGDYYYDSAAEALAKLLTVDGAGSGLDADRLDGQQGSYYFPTSSFTSANVLVKVALGAFDGVGTYAWCSHASGNISEGVTVAGNTLNPGGAVSGITQTVASTVIAVTLAGGVVLSGTWRCMGKHTASKAGSNVTLYGSCLWLKIS